MELTNYNRDKNKKRPAAEFSSMVYGKVPPQARELEEAVLGAIMLEKRAFDKMIEINLRHECFYVEAHQIVFATMEKMYQEGVPIDIMTVVEYLKRSNQLEIIGGAYYVTKLTDSVVTSANIETHGRIIMEKFIHRELIRVSTKTISEAYDDATDVFELLKLAEFELRNVSENIYHTTSSKSRNEDNAMNILTKLNERVGYARAGTQNPNDIFTELKDWDKINGALFPGLYVVAGRPAMGKGNHMVQCAINMGSKFDVGVINGEMYNEQFLRRCASNIKDINNEIWNRKNPFDITDEEIRLVEEALGEVCDLKIHLEEEQDIFKIAAKIRYWVEVLGVKCVMVDYLTILKMDDSVGKYFTEVQRINYILGILAGLSKKLKIPIILYVQMNRDILKRGGSQEPNMGDLKGSGMIEELAYQISFLHRPEYYDPNAICDEFGESIKNLMYQIIVKHREGELGRIKYKALMAFSKLESWDKSNFTPNPEERIPF